MSDRLVATYIGAGEFFPGVPARDIDEADWAALSADEKALVRGSSVYRMASAHPESPALPIAPPVQPATAPSGELAE